MLIGAITSVLLSMVFVARYFENTNTLNVVFLDVGQGDAIFITTVTGKQVLIDGGAFPDVDVAIGKYMNFYDRSIDLVIATHPDLDHIGGLTTVLRRYTVPVFLYSGLHSGISAYQQLVNILISSDTSIVTAKAGQVITLDEDTSLTVLSPYPNSSSTEPNEKSVVVQLVYGNTSMLLTGDASVFNEYDMVSVYNKHLRSDILKLGHHGSKTSSSSWFIDTVNPQYAVVSAGCDNSFGHPHKEVITRLIQRNIIILNTCLQGDIIFESDGDTWTMGK